MIYQLGATLDAVVGTSRRARYVLPKAQSPTNKKRPRSEWLLYVAYHSARFAKRGSVSGRTGSWESPGKSSLKLIQAHPCLQTFGKGRSNLGERHCAPYELFPDQAVLAPRLWSWWRILAR